MEWWQSLPQNRKQKKRRKKYEDSLRDFWDNIKHTNICIIGVPEEEREKGPEKIFEELIAENFPNMGKEIVNQVQEAESPRQDKPKEEHMETHNNQTGKIKDQDKTLKATREKQQIAYK